MRWMLGGPELGNILEDFESDYEKNFSNLGDYHHNEGLTSQLRFKDDVEKLVSAWEGVGNPFEEECPRLINIYNRSVPPNEVAECVFNLGKAGKL